MEGSVKQLVKRNTQMDRLMQLEPEVKVERLMTLVDLLRKFETCSELEYLGIRGSIRSSKDKTLSDARYSPILLGKESFLSVVGPYALGETSTIFNFIFDSGTYLYVPINHSFLKDKSSLRPKEANIDWKYISIPWEDLGRGRELHLGYFN